MKKIKTYVLTVSRTFTATHKRKGEETKFPEKINFTLMGISDKIGTFPMVKMHTIRSNYELWNKRIAEIQRGNAILSIRYWSGKPYNSKQVEICQLDKYSGIGVQKLNFINSVMAISIHVDKQNTKYENPFAVTVAKNDGLSLEDFKEWFKKYDLSEPMAIIHFTKFRY